MFFGVSTFQREGGAFYLLLCDNVGSNELVCVPPRACLLPCERRACGVAVPRTPNPCWSRKRALARPRARMLVPAWRLQPHTCAHVRPATPQTLAMAAGDAEEHAHMLAGYFLEIGQQVRVGGVAN